VQVDYDDSGGPLPVPGPSNSQPLQLRKPPGRPATTKQRLFDAKLKPFDKRCAMDSDTVWLPWFTDDEVACRAVRGGESEVADHIAAQACDARAQIEEVQHYFSTSACSKFVSRKAATAACRRCYGLHQLAAASRRLP